MLKPKIFFFQSTLLNLYFISRSTWWLIPLSKWVITPIISGLTLLIPFITGVITHLLSGMSHQVVYFQVYGRVEKKNFPAQLGRIWSALRSHELGPCVRESGARSYSCFYPLHSFTAARVYLICSNLNIDIWQCVKTFSFSRRLESQTLVKQGLAARRGLGSSPHTKVSVLRHSSMY